MLEPAPSPNRLDARGGLLAGLVRPIGDAARQTVWGQVPANTSGAGILTDRCGETAWEFAVDACNRGGFTRSNWVTVDPALAWGSFPGTVPALNAAGTLLAVGDPDANNDAGRVTVYQRQPGPVLDARNPAWVQVAELEGEAGDRLGAALSVHPDMPIVAVGAPGADQVHVIRMADPRASWVTLQGSRDGQTLAITAHERNGPVVYVW